MPNDAPQPQLAVKPSQKREDYQYWSAEKVRFSDLDAVGHANNNAVGAFFEAARVELLRDMGIKQVNGDIVCVLATMTVDYLKETHLFEQVHIGQKVARIGNSSFTLHSATFVDRDGQSICTGLCSAVCVLVDGKTHRPVSIPDFAREYLTRHA